MNTANNDNGQRWLNLLEATRLLDHRITPQTLFGWVERGERPWGLAMEARRDDASRMTYLSENSVLAIKEKLPRSAPARPRRTAAAFVPHRN